MANLCGIGAQLREIEKSQVSHVPSVGDYVFLFENPYLRRGRITCITENSREAYLIDLGVTKVNLVLEAHIFIIVLKYIL